MNTIDPKDRLKQIFDSTVESGLKHVGNIDELDFYTLLCNATANNKVYKILNCNLLMFNYEFNNEDSILIVFSIPVSISNENKHVSERIMDILKLVEDCFITVDYMDLKSSKEDKFSYMTVIKSLKEEESY